MNPQPPHTLKFRLAFSFGLSKIKRHCLRKLRIPEQLGGEILTHSKSGSKNIEKAEVVARIIAADNHDGAIAHVGKTKEEVNEMKIGNLEFSNVEEGGLIYDPDPAYTQWLRMMGRDASKRFWVFLWNKVTGKAKITKVALPNGQDWCPAEYNGEDQKELLRAAFLLEE